jgi:colanic acid/amylovoran biosynthesis glycosyltransferase
VRIAYIVSRFPLASETFVVRELNGVDGRDGVEIPLLLSLYRPARPFAHPEAERWLERLRRPSAPEAARATATWLGRSPLTMLRAIARIAWDRRRSPGHLVRGLATVPLAAAHAQTVRGAGIEHVHAHFATYPALTAWLCGRLTGVSYSFTAHAHDLYVDQSGLATVVGDAAFVATISDFNRRFLAEHAPHADTPVHVVRCGIRPGAYAGRSRPLPAEGDVHALSVASLEEYKGHAVLLRALAEGGPLQRIRLTLIGAGSLEAQLRALAQQLGIASRVEFRGAQDEGQVAAALAASDLFVLPSVVAADGQMEGLPVGLMEALAAELPVVSTRLSGIPELVRDGETGWLATPGDAPGLADALRAVLADPAEAAARAAAGRRLVEAQYDVRRSAAQMAQLLTAAVSARR